MYIYHALEWFPKCLPKKVSNEVLFFLVELHTPDAHLDLVIGKCLTLYLEAREGPWLTPSAVTGAFNSTCWLLTNDCWAGHLTSSVFPDRRIHLLNHEIEVQDPQKIKQDLSGAKNKSRPDASWLPYWIFQGEHDNYFSCFKSFIP